MTSGQKFVPALYNGAAALTSGSRNLSAGWVPKRREPVSLLGARPWAAWRCEKAAVSMEFKKCKECGFPVRFARWLRWDNNGTIVQRISPDFRVVIMETNFLEDLFGRIEKNLGISVRHIVFEAQKSGAKGFINNWLAGPLGKLLLIPKAKGFVINQFHMLAILGGSAYSETVEYKSGEYGVALIKNPYSKELMAAMVEGAFEAMEGKPYTHSWAERGEDLVLRVEAVDRPPDISDRMYLVLPPAHPGNIQFARCKRCGVPLDLRYLKWYENKGIILDTRRDKRVNFLDGYVPATVFREFRKELGDTVVPIIIDAQREYFLEYIHELALLKLARGDLKNMYHIILDTLPVYGQGNPVSIVRTDSRLEVTVENPYDELLLAGTLAACYQAVEEAEPEVTFKQLEEGILHFVILPKKS